MDIKYDDGAGIIQGPFDDCDCPSHHEHGQNGEDGCPVCNPPKESISEYIKRLLNKKTK